MSDLINRQAALDTLKGFNVFDIIPYEYGVIYVQAVINAIYDRLNNLPSAELERKKGEWNFIGDNMFKCTCCGVLYTTHQLNGLRNYETDPYAPYFCPNCGADLRGENE